METVGEFAGGTGEGKIGGPVGGVPPKGWLTPPPTSEF